LIHLPSRGQRLQIALPSLLSSNEYLKTIASSAVVFQAEHPPVELVRCLLVSKTGEKASWLGRTIDMHCELSSSGKRKRCDARGETIADFGYHQAEHSCNFRDR